MLQTEFRRITSRKFHRKPDASGKRFIPHILRPVFRSGKLSDAVERADIVPETVENKVFIPVDPKT